MEISIRIREKLRKGLITVCLFYCGFHSALLGQSLSRSKQNNNMVTSRHYSSAFAGPQNKVVSSFSFGEYDFRDTLPGKNYTIEKIYKIYDSRNLRYTAIILKKILFDEGDIVYEKFFEDFRFA